MAVHLLDINVLIALAWPNHVHHATARHWFGIHAVDGWATCPMTQCGFVRISSNPKIISVAILMKVAIDALGQIVAHPHHTFWPDDIMFGDATHIQHNRLNGARQVTDAYLLGLARRHGGKLATMDAGILQLAPAEWGEMVEIIKVRMDLD